MGELVTFILLQRVSHIAYMINFHDEKHLFVESTSYNSYSLH